MPGREVHVFLFTGFLESGKTKFIQSTLEDARFNSGEKILLLLCEEGEEEYDATSFASPNVVLKLVEDEAELTERNLKKWLRDAGAVRVMVEYNGMWSLPKFFEAMPENWLIAQEICFAEATTYPVFNANMRNLVYEKLQTCDAVIFNRCVDSTDTEALHKIVRQANRRCDIVYEYTDGRTVPDVFVDPLPFDINAPVVKIEDRDYAYFIADLMENLSNYEGKTVQFLAFCADNRSLPGNAIVAGRMLMNCCAADLQLAGMVCYWHEKKKPAKGEWYRMTGRIGLVPSQEDGEPVPILRVSSAVKESEPEDPVAAFY